mgnify:CR=1 FL=1
MLETRIEIFATLFLLLSSIIRSDLFIVYARGSNLPGRVDDSFGDLFQDALDEPIIDYFVIKLRYRFGI